MRRNLDQSEAAIVQVFEEKQRVWERQMDELRQNYASRLQQVTSEIIPDKVQILPKFTKAQTSLLKYKPFYLGLYSLIKVSYVFAKWLSGLF